MKPSRILPACALLIFAFSGLAQASPFVDPAIIIGGRNSAIFFTPGNTSVSLTFNTDARCTAGMTTLNNVSLPSMLCGIVNQTGLPLTGFTFSFNSPQLLTLLVSTATPGLGSWTQNFNGTLATFMFATPLPTPNGDIAINFVNFGVGLPIGVAAVPEPASLTLVGAGLGALLMRRRARRAIG